MNFGGKITVRNMTLCAEERCSAVSLFVAELNLMA